MKYIPIVASMAFAISNTAVAADSPIIVHNESAQDLVAAIYYYDDAATRSTSLYDVPAHSLVAMPRPIKKRLSSWNPLYFDRELVFLPSKAAFKDVFSKAEFQRLPRTNVGDKQVVIKPDIFIVQDDGILKGYNWQEWTVQEPVLRAAGKLYATTKEVAGKVAQGAQDFAASLKQQVKNYYKNFKQDNPYKDTVARVQVGNALSQEEQAFLAARQPNVKKALEKLLDTPLDNAAYIPKIAFAGSGGGYRAMLCTTGSLVGAQRIGLLDASTWVVGLSGSTWAIGLWMTNGITITQFRDLICSQLKQPLQSISVDQAQQLMEFLMVKYAQDQELTLVDIYGCLLSNRLLDNFGNKKYQQYLSQQAALIKHGDWPMPIYTAALTHRNKPAQWYEYTPYQIGSAELGMYVPTWAFGRTFKDGASTDAVLEQHIGYHLGTFGSAFAIRFNTVYESFKKKSSNKQLLEAVESVFNEIAKEQMQEIGSRRINLSWAAVPNFALGLTQNADNNEPLLKLSDAGLDFNLPYPPVSGQRAERKADIIIFLDASNTIKDVPHLKKAKEYAQRNKLKFPAINDVQIGTKACTVLKDDNDPDAPVIIYLPRIKDNDLWLAMKDKQDFGEYKNHLDTFDPEQCTAKEHCGTTNFVYTEQQARQLCALAEFNMRASKQAIVDAIKWVMEKKAKK